jgi:GTPase SAR1 family protein
MSSALEAKIVVLGAQGVGKTSLVMRYCKGAFDSSQVTSTVGASFMTKRVVDSDTDTVVRLQIWDTGTVALPSNTRQQANVMLTKHYL